MTEKLKTFEVVRTPKLRDATGAYRKRGETCQLTKSLAEHYHKLGYIRVQMDTLFNDTEAEATAAAAGTDGSADVAPDSGGPSGDESVIEAGTADEEQASQNAEDDAGTGETETGGGRIANRRRKRATS